MIPIAPHRSGLLALALVLPALGSASMPCNLPQVSLSPPTNSTAVSGPISVRVTHSEWLPVPLEKLVRVVDAQGQPADAHVEQVDGGPSNVVSITGLSAPGWYTVSVALPDGWESGDHSLWVRDGGFEGELRVGESAPAISTVDECASGSASGAASTTVLVRWSEPVIIAGPPGDALVIDTASGPLSCTANSTPTDGGSVFFLRLTCPADAGLIDSIRLVQPPLSAQDGGPAVFPPIGVDWATTGWAGEDAFALPYGCAQWQPSVRGAGHQSLLRSNTPSSYNLCQQPSACGCSTGEGVLGVLGLLLLAGWSRVRAR